MKEKLKQIDEAITYLTNKRYILGKTDPKEMHKDRLEENRLRRKRKKLLKELYGDVMSNKPYNRGKGE